MAEKKVIPISKVKIKKISKEEVFKEIKKLVKDLDTFLIEYEKNKKASKYNRFDINKFNTENIKDYNKIIIEGDISIQAFKLNDKEWILSYITDDIYEE